MLDVIDESTCPLVEEQIQMISKPLRIELDDSLLSSFNELSNEELEFVFGAFRPVKSLNPYMTKLSLCSITQAGLSLVYPKLLVSRLKVAKSVNVLQFSRTFHCQKGDFRSILWAY